MARGRAMMTVVELRVAIATTVLRGAIGLRATIVPSAMIEAGRAAAVGGLVADVRTSSACRARRVRDANGRSEANA